VKPILPSYMLDRDDIDTAHVKPHPSGGVSLYIGGLSLVFPSPEDAEGVVDGWAHELTVARGGGR
jgi:hypothetical protein